MLWRKLNQVFCRKGNALTVILVILWGIAGMSLQYHLYCMKAADLKWSPLERMGEDWYYYMNDTEQGVTDLKKQAVKAKSNVLEMWQLRTTGADEMDVFQYSEKAWDWFHYPVEEGTGFSPAANEIIVSPGLAKQYPVGSEIKITTYQKRKSKFTNEETEFVCTVVGVLGQGEIYFRFNEPGRVTQLQNAERNMFCGSQTYRTLFQRSLKFGIVNPRLNVSENCKDESSGVFFQTTQDNVGELEVTYRDIGQIKAVSQILDESGQSASGVNYFRLGLLVLVWIAAIVYTMMWHGCLLRRNVEELSYLIYIKYNKVLVWRRFLRISISRFAIAWLVSCLAYFLPNDFYWFWNMHWYVPFITLPLYVVAGCVSRCLANMYLRDRYLAQTQKYIGDAELLNYLYIEDLSVTENLLLILLAQNYPERTAVQMVKNFLIERDIYYRNWRMKRLDIQKKFEFYQLRDELLTSRDS